MLRSWFSFDRVRAFWETLLILVFLGLILLPAADTFFGLDHAPIVLENRAPAKWPEFEGLRDSRSFMAGVENYFNDHFGFRKRLVRWNNHWKGQLFHEGGGREVLIGRDGWMFYTGADMYQHLTREETWSQQQLENWRRFLEMRRDWLAERGCKYIFVVPPDKHTVYPEYLPSWLRPGAKPSKLQQLVAYMKAHSTVEVVDLTEPLLEAKTLRPEYLQTDTHWNAFGGFIGSQTVIAELSQQMPGLKPLSPDLFQWKLAPRHPGDLTVMFGTSEGHPEHTSFEWTAADGIAEFKPQVDPVRLPKLKPTDQNTVYTINENAAGKAMFFRDSFSGAWMQFMARHFHEAIYVWHYQWDRPLIEREQPDVVIDEMVERFFNLADPLEMAAQDVASATNTCLANVPHSIVAAGKN